MTTKAVLHAMEPSYQTVFENKVLLALPQIAWKTINDCKIKQNKTKNSSNDLVSEISNFRSNLSPLLLEPKSTAVHSQQAVSLVLAVARHDTSR